MGYSKTELAEIILTRTCHDLIGNIGTLQNVLEFIGPDGVMDPETRGLLAAASDLLNARQKFFRVAFGITTIAHSTEELKELCERYVATVGTRNCPIVLNFQGISPQLSKMICLCVMTAADIFIKGGHIDIAVNKENITIRATTDYKFQETEIKGYQTVIADQKPSDNISQYAQLIYLRELLGTDVPMKLEATATEFSLVIG